MLCVRLTVYEFVALSYYVFIFRLSCGVLQTIGLSSFYVSSEIADVRFQVKNSQTSRLRTCYVTSEPLLCLENFQIIYLHFRD